MEEPTERMTSRLASHDDRNALPVKDQMARSSCKGRAADDGVYEVAQRAGARVQAAYGPSAPMWRLTTAHRPRREDC